MAAFRITRIKTASFATVAIDGVVEITIEETISQASGLSDAAVGPTSIDNVGSSITGTLVTDDEDNDLTLLTGAAGVLTATYQKAGGGTGTLTIGLVTDATGVVFTGANDTTIPLGESSGSTPRMALSFVAKYKPTYTKGFGTSNTTAMATLT